MSFKSIDVNSNIEINSNFVLNSYYNELEDRLVNYVDVIGFDIGRRF